MDENSKDFITKINSITQSLNFYMLILIILIGVPGNLLSLFIFTRPRLNRKTNTGFLYTWLSLLNLITISACLFINRPQYLFGYFFPKYPCGLADLIRRTCFSSVSWMQVQISSTFLLEL